MNLNDSEKEIQEKIDNFEENFKPVRLSIDKRLNKTGKQLEILELTLRKLGSSKRKDKNSKDINKRLVALEDKLQHIPSRQEECDQMLQDIIGKIINIESSKCNYVPASVTSAILTSLQEQMTKELKNQ